MFKCCTLSEDPELLCNKYTGSRTIWSEHILTCSFICQTYIQLCVRVTYNNLKGFHSQHLLSKGQMPLCGRMYVTHSKEGRPPTLQSVWQIQQEGLAVSQHPTHCASLRVSRTLHCCVTLKARWPEGGGCLLCQSDKARLALFVPLQGQFAVCDLSKGNAIWQELLTSEEHLGVSEDIGHSYSFRVYPFVIVKTDSPLCFLVFNLDEVSLAMSSPAPVRWFHSYAYLPQQRKGGHNLTSAGTGVQLQ